MKKFTVLLAVGCVFNVLGIASYMQGRTTVAYLLVIAGLVAVFTAVIANAREAGKKRLPADEDSKQE